MFKINGQEISDPSVIADKFCSYFSNIGPNLADKTPQSSISHLSSLSGCYQNSIYIKLTSQSEIIEIATGFDSNKAPGYDNIPMAVVRHSMGIISRPLTHIINLCISHGMVPEEMKIARVIPLFKSGDQEAFTNYRPVSILPCFHRRPNSVCSFI